MASRKRVSWRVLCTVAVMVLASTVGCSANDATDQQDGGGADAGGADAGGTVQDGGGNPADGGVDAAATADGGGGADAQVPQPFWANTHIDFSGGGVAESVDMADCYFCDASDVGSHTLLRYQQGGGYTIWALYIPSGATTGTHALSTDYTGFYATLSANDASLPAAAQGFYFGNVNVGSVTLTSVNLAPGGSVDGSIDVSWTKDGVTAHAVSTFHAELP